MSSVTFILIYSFSWLITRLPLRLLYLFSDLVFFINYHLIGYRKKLTIRNLELAFPGKSKKEIRSIARKFFIHLADYFIESIYLLGLSGKEGLRRYKFKNPEVLEDLHAKGKSVILVLPHYANWEWLAVSPLILPFKVLGIYKPLANKAFDRLFVKLRERFGVETVSMKQTLRKILQLQGENVRTLSLFLYDQRPVWDELYYWIPFLNREIPVLEGAEKIARKTGQAVVYLKCHKLKRGYYQNEFVCLFEDGEAIPERQMTEQFWKILEEDLHREPAYWLWSHDRWKYDRKDHS